MLNSGIPAAEELTCNSPDPDVPESPSKSSSVAGSELYFEKFFGFCCSGLPLHQRHCIQGIWDEHGTPADQLGSYHLPAGSYRRGYFNDALQSHLQRDFRVDNAGPADDFALSRRPHPLSTGHGSTANSPQYGRQQRHRFQKTPHGMFSGERSQHRKLRSLTLCNRHWPPRLEYALEWEAGRCPLSRLVSAWRLYVSFLGRFGPSRAFRVSHVRTFFLLLGRDFCWRFCGGYGIAREVNHLGND